MRLYLPESKAYLPGPGRCIYCWPKRHTTGRLTKEHIIARTLGGKLVLHNASCDECARTINKDIEQPTLQNMLAFPRNRLGLPTSTPKRNLSMGRAKVVEPIVVGQTFESPVRYEEHPLADHPIIITLPKFYTPSILSGQPRTAGSEWQHQFSVYFSPSVIRPDEEGILYKSAFSPLKFGRFLAKIAHGAAVAELGLNTFKPLLPDIILGEDRNIGFLIGKSGRVARKHSALHVIMLHNWADMVVADIQLFARYGLAPYRVFVGHYLGKHSVRSV